MTDIRQLLDPLTLESPPPPPMEELSRRVGLRRRRRRRLTSLAVVVGLVGAGVGVLQQQRSGETTVTAGFGATARQAPDTPAQASALLPDVSMFTSLLPGLHVGLAHDGKTWGDNSPAPGAVFTVTRQWVTAQGSLSIPPGRPFPDVIFTVSAVVARFAGHDQARAFVQGLDRPGAINHGWQNRPPLPTDFSLLELPGNQNGALPMYVGGFTAGPVAFVLEMVASRTALHEARMFTVMQFWIGELPFWISGVLPSGTVIGSLILSGRSVPGGSQFIAGTVTIRPLDPTTRLALQVGSGSTTVTQPVAASSPAYVGGGFRVNLPIGTYDITGQSPAYQNGAGTCHARAVIRVQKTHPTELVIACPVK
jgi:hypothetical protein